MIVNRFGSLIIFIGGILVTASVSIAAKDLATARPEKVGMSSERLARINPLMRQYVESGELIGAVTMIARHGQVVHFEKFGDVNKETGQDMAVDSIFRIYSMTKPITTVAAMMLYEQGKFQLSDPVEKYLPEFKNILVLGEDSRPVKQDKPFTIENLMTHTAGFTYGFSGTTPVDRRYREADILAKKDLAAMVTELGNIPLLYQPGTRWRYSVSIDVLGRLVEVISGQPLDEYFKQHIFDPLEMHDTFFEVPADKLNRFGTNHRFNRESNELEIIDRPDSTSPFTDDVTFFSGGGGLLSTAEDYMRFCMMVLNGGELNGVRLLGRKTVEFMTRDHLQSIFGGFAGDTSGLNPGTGFGLGFAVVGDVPRAGVIGSDGEYNWGGAAGTIFWIDPVEDLIVIVMIQHQNVQIPLRNAVKALVYSSIIE